MCASAPSLSSSSLSIFTSVHIYLLYSSSSSSLSSSSFFRASCACVRACVRAFSLSIFFIRAAFLYRKVERQVVDVYVDRLQPLVRERYSVELGALGDGKGVQIPLVLW